MGENLRGGGTYQKKKKKTVFIIKFIVGNETQNC